MLPIVALMLPDMYHYMYEDQQIIKINFFRHIIVRPFCPALCSMPVVVALALFNCVLCTVCPSGFAGDVGRGSSHGKVRCSTTPPSGAIPAISTWRWRRSQSAVNQPDAVSAWGKVLVHNV